MEFEFKGKTITADDCLVFVGGFMTYDSNKRFHFHETTYAKFEDAPAAYEDSDDNPKKAICHSYSFNSMAKYLYYFYNQPAGSQFYIGELLRAVYLVDKVTDLNNTKNNPGDGRETAYNIYKRMFSNSTKKKELVEYFNQLLYVLNNAYPNLRIGNSSCNSSIGDAYDPAPGYYDKKHNRFVINNSNDVFRLRILINVPIKPPTLYFYTAELNGQPYLYSSDNNPFIPCSKFDYNKTPIFVSYKGEYERIT